MNINAVSVAASLCYAFRYTRDVNTDLDVNSKHREAGAGGNTKITKKVLQTLRSKATCTFDRLDLLGDP